jgi:uncharacterized lipoprotein YmbA
MLKTPLLIAAATLLVACSGPTNRLDMSPVTSSLQLRANVGSAMVRTVSLPAYAAAEELAIETEDGFISSSADILWADDPERAVTLLMTGHLNQILGVNVGPDPWPFAGLPDVAIDVRIQQLLAGADGTFRLRGQYFVGGDGIDYPNASRSVSIDVPVNGEGPAAVALAQSQALLQLSEEIARSLGR